MSNEYGLFIIWNNARCKEKEIINDIKERFELLNIFEIEWSKHIFSNNLTRFYGENLPKNSSKEKHCGNGKFLLVIVKDNNPIYGYRRTTKGKKYVNVNMFDSKAMYRFWTGQHMVHGTNDTEEFKHDLMLLLGLNIEDYLKKYNRSDNFISFNKNVVGSNGWESLEQVFYVLNETIPYVVLRNFSSLPEKYEVGIHSDIDILCSNRDNISKILNAIRAKKSKKRSRYYITVNDNKVFMDLRYLGDNYYDLGWQKTILKKRTINRCFYIPDDDNYKYSLLYHALVHKGKIASDYLEKFNDFFSTEDVACLRKKLDKYMLDNNYNYVDPVDYSVGFNYKTTKKRMSFPKNIICFFLRIYYKIKRCIKHEK